MGAILHVEQLHKRYTDVAALAGVSFTIQGGEFFTLRPSGCGKTTLLRCVAGFLRPDGGQILCEGESLDRLPAHKRDIDMVFQNYAIFPHLTVFENVAYGLRARRVAPTDIHSDGDTTATFSFRTAAYSNTWALSELRDIHTVIPRRRARECSRHRRRHVRPCLPDRLCPWSLGAP